MRDTCRIHAAYMHPKRLSRYMLDTCGYIRGACEIHTGYVSLGLKGMYRCHHRVCSAPIRPPIAPCVVVGLRSSTLQLLHLLLYHGHPEGGGEGGGGEGDGDRATAKRTTQAGQEEHRREARELLWLLWHLRHCQGACQGT